MAAKPTPREVLELERDALLDALRKVTELAAGAEATGQRFVACYYIAAYGRAALDSYQAHAAERYRTRTGREYFAPGAAEKPGGGP